MLIQPMLERLRAARGLQQQLHTALADVIALLGAERGDLQLLDAEEHLVIVEQQGLPSFFLQVLGRIPLDGAAVCARAARQMETVFVPDVEVDEAFLPLRDVARRVPFRSVISAPIVGPDDAAIGALSVHFANRFTPSRLELESLTTYCRQLGRFLAQTTGAQDLRRHAATLARAHVFQ